MIGDKIITQNARRTSRIMAFICGQPMEAVVHFPTCVMLFEVSYQITIEKETFILDRRGREVEDLR